MNYYNGLYNPEDEQLRLKREIEDRQNLLTKLQNARQSAPINNYINTGNVRVDLEGKILSEGQSINDIIVQNRTLFIDEKNKKVAIKEVDGTISKEYEIVIPLTAEQKEIQELKANNNMLLEKIKQMEVLINDEYSKSNKSIKQNKQSNECNARNDESSTKTNNE